MNLDRRKFLASMLEGGAGCSALRMLFSSIVLGSLEKAMGLSNGKKYVHIQEYLAPPRWMFDLFLNPSNQSNFQHTDFLGSRFVNVNGRYQKVVYETIERKGIHVPYTWQFDLPAKGGGTRSMDELLSSMLQIRGIDALNAGHDIASANWYKGPNWPLGTLALAADQGIGPIPCVALGNHLFTLGSAKGLSPLVINDSNAQMASSYNNLIKHIMDPFIFTESEVNRVLRGQIQDALSDLQNVQDSLLVSRRAEYSAITHATSSAKELIYGALGDIEQFWLGTIAKYQDLTQRGFSQQLASFDEYPVGTEDRNDKTQLFDNQPHMNSDIRTAITSNTFVNGLAEYYTVAEYLLRNNLSSAITLCVRDTRNVGPNGSYPSDEHFTGFLPSLYVNTKRHRAGAACLLELMDVIKSIGQFNDTLILYCSEFNRNVRYDGTGTDHNYLGASVCLYSGQIDGPYVIGNITSYGEPYKWIGTYGRGAVNPELGGNLDVNYIPPTVATFLGASVKGINDKYTSLVQRDGVKVRPKLGQGIIVD